MELHTLRPAKGATKSRKRIARGQGSGFGGTSTRGHKGAKSRSGYSRKRNFEGGQMPIQMRLPKRGFKNHNRVSYVPFNVDRLEAISKKLDTNDLSIAKLVEHGYMKKNERIKILASGEIGTGLQLEAHACSESAKKSIEAKGGSIKIV